MMTLTKKGLRRYTSIASDAFILSVNDDLEEERIATVLPSLNLEQKLMLTVNDDLDKERIATGDAVFVSPLLEDCE